MSNNILIQKKILDYTEIKGSYFINPIGVSFLESFSKKLDKKIKAKKIISPAFISEQLLTLEENLGKEFKKECFKITNSEKYLKPKTYIRVNLDVDISYEEATHIKQVFTDEYNLREIVLLPEREDEHEIDWSEGEAPQFQSVDQIVLNELSSIKSTQINNNKLVDIYNNLTV